MVSRLAGGRRGQRGDGREAMAGRRAGLRPWQARGVVHAWGGWWEGGPVRLTPRTSVSCAARPRQYANEAQDLRGLLRGENIDPRELDEIVNALRQLQDDRVYQNVEELARPAGLRG